MNQTSSLPTNKAWAALIASEVVAILVWALRTWAKVDVPPDIAVAANGIITFIACYITPPASRDTIEGN